MSGLIGIYSTTRRRNISRPAVGLMSDLIGIWSALGRQPDIGPTLKTRSQPKFGIFVSPLSGRCPVWSAFGRHAVIVPLTAHQAKSIWAATGCQHHANVFCRPLPSAGRHRANAGILAGYLDISGNEETDRLARHQAQGEQEDGIVTYTNWTATKSAKTCTFIWWTLQLVKASSDDYSA